MVLNLRATRQSARDARLGGFEQGFRYRCQAGYGRPRRCDAATAQGHLPHGGCNRTGVRSELTNSRAIWRPPSRITTAVAYMQENRGERKLTPRSRTVAVSVAMGLLAIASIAAARATSPMPQAGTPKPDQHHGMMMGGDHSMMEMMRGMDAAQRTRMIENCKRMMGASSEESPESPGAPKAPETKPNG